MKNRKLLLLAPSLVLTLVGCLPKSICGICEEPNEHNHRLFRLQPRNTSTVKADNFVYELDSDGKYYDSNPDDFEDGVGEISVNGSLATKDYLDAELKPIVESTPSVTYSTSSYTDSYENNDDFKNAASLKNGALGPIGGQGIEHIDVRGTITEKTSEWWLFSSKYIDKDFYSYDVTSKGSLIVGLTVPDDVDYDVRLFKCPNGLDEGYGDLDFNEADSLVAEGKSGGVGESESFFVDVEPGTYYIVVYSYQDTYFNESEPYTLSIAEEADMSSFNVVEAKEDGSLGAVWVSDYKPADLDPSCNVFEEGDNRVALKNIEENPLLFHLSERFDGSNSITYSTIYVWNKDLRYVLYCYYRGLLESFYTSFCDEFGNIIEEPNTYEKASFVLDQTSVAVSWAGRVINAVNLFNLFPKFESSLEKIAFTMDAVSVLLELSSTIVSKIGEYKTFRSTLSQIKDYLINIVAALERGSSTGDETIMIPYTYRFGNAGGDVYLDWSPLYVPGAYNIFAGTYIHRTNDDSPFTGTIKPIKKFGVNLDLGSC